MSRFKFALAFVTTLVTFSVGAAPAKTKARAAVKRQKVFRSTRVEIGLGYVQWNEAITAQQSSAKSTGYANYAGPLIALDMNRIVGRWQFGALTALAAGRASAGGFDSPINFTDANQRAWYAAFLHPSAGYRINPVFTISGGLMARLRVVDWEPADQTLKIETANVISYAPSLSARFTFPHLTILQTFSTGLTDSSTQWTWALQYVF